MSNKFKLQPAEIQTIRESLGLSLARAGQLFGGGGGAFVQYEQGRRQPSNATNTLLILARDHPQLIKTTMGLPTTTRLRPRPQFEVRPEHIASLELDDLYRLTIRLVRADDSSQDLVEFSSDQDTLQPGLDSYIPSRNTKRQTTKVFLLKTDCVFQLRSEAVSPSELTKEVLTKSGKIVKHIREVLQGGGSYVVICTKEYSEQLVNNRKTALLDCFWEHGLTVLDEQIEFKEATMIASWINQYQAIALWFLELHDSRTFRYFRSWDRAFLDSIHSATEYVEDDRLKELQNELSCAIAEDRSCRVKGFSGVGKTRLVLECFNNRRDFQELRDFVMYLDAKHTSDEQIVRIVEQLIQSDAMVVLILDSASSNVNRHLFTQVQQYKSNVLIIAIEDCDEADGFRPDDISIEEASQSVTQELVSAWCGDIQSLDKKLLTQLTKGFPKFTKLICDSWVRNGSVSISNPYDLAQDFVGENEENPSSLLKSARIIAVCGGICDWKSKEFEDALVTLDSKLSVEQFNQSIYQLHRRGIIKKYGNGVTIEPKVLALTLAEYQWKLWDSKTWESVLFGKLNFDLKECICKQLSLLNQTKIAKEVVNEILQLNNRIRKKDSYPLLINHSKFLFWLVQIEPNVVVSVIQDLVDYGVTQQKDSDVENDFVAALNVSAYQHETFANSAKLLMKIFVDTSNDYAFRTLCEIFAIFGTAADGSLRLQILMSWVEDENPKLRETLTRLLESIIHWEFASRIVGPEKHGTKSAIESWKPKSPSEFQAYIEGVVRILDQIAKVDDQLGTNAATSLDRSLAYLLKLGWVSFVEIIVENFQSRPHRCWPEMCQFLWTRLWADSPMDNLVRQRLEVLYVKLIPKTTDERLKSFLDGTLLNRYSLFRDNPAVLQQEEAEIRQLVQAVVEDEKLLNQNIIGLCRNNPYGITLFGQELARSIENPHIWLRRIRGFVEYKSAESREFDFMLGYIRGLLDQNQYRTEIVELKNDIAKSKELAPMFPRLCVELGLESSDLELTIELVANRDLNSKHLEDWSHRNVFKNVSGEVFLNFLNRLIDQGLDGFIASVEILASHYEIVQDYPNTYTALLCKQARFLGSWPHAYSQNSGSPFVKAMKAVLANQQQDRKASRLAAVLSKTLIDAIKARGINGIQEIVPPLIDRYPEITLSAIKREVGQKPQQSMLVYEFSEKKPNRTATPWILMFPFELLIDWCYEDKTSATLFLGQTIPFLDQSTLGVEPKIHTSMLLLIEEFSAVESLWDGILTNLRTFVWRNEKAPYYERYMKPIDKLCDHDMKTVRKGARKLREEIEKSYRMELIEDQERKGREFF